MASARHDLLTRLQNRLALHEDLAVAVGHAHATGEPLALISASLDRFRELNERLGYQAGDQALLATAEAIRSQLRQRQLAYRTGGDEFIVLAPAVSPTDADQLAKRLAGAIADCYPTHPVQATIVATSLAHGDTPDDLGRRAYTALWVARSPWGAGLVELVSAADLAAQTNLDGQLIGLVMVEPQPASRLPAPSVTSALAEYLAEFTTPDPQLEGPYPAGTSRFAIISRGLSDPELEQFALHLAGTAPHPVRHGHTVSHQPGEAALDLIQRAWDDLTRRP